MLLYRAVSHFDSQASVVTHTLSEAECSKNRWLKIVIRCKKIDNTCVYTSVQKIVPSAFHGELCIDWILQTLKGGNFVASRKTH